MNVSGISGITQPRIMSGASARMSPQQKMSSLYEKIDQTGSGSISKAQLQDAFKTLNPPAVFKAQGPDAIFKKLDPNGTGKVSRTDFINKMKELMVSLRASAGSLNSLGV